MPLHCGHQPPIFPAGKFAMIFVFALFGGCCESRRETPAASDAILEKSAWPSVLADAMSEANAMHIDTGEVRVYHYNVDEYFLDCNASPELITFLSARWELSPVKENDAMMQRFWKRLPKGLLSPRSEDIDCFLSAGWIAGEKGHQFCVVHDKHHHRLVLRYYYNF